jgi:hypothetical protein
MAPGPRGGGSSTSSSPAERIRHELNVEQLSLLVDVILDTLATAPSRSRSLADGAGPITPPSGDSDVGFRVFASLRLSPSPRSIT